MSIDAEDEDDIITMEEFVESDRRNLAGCDDDLGCCTFPRGYVSRQAIYLCVTCLKLSNKSAGVCYPCSIHCHEGHELLDLYTKRNFRCDCGNGSFSENFRCTLWEDKDDINIKNIYNQNFSEKFCLCGTQYKGRNEDEDMYQCNLCEDWFHLSCLADHSTKLTLPSDIIVDNKEFTCKKCINNHEYLRLYNLALTSNNLADNGPNACKFLNLKALLQLSLSKMTLSYGVFWPEEWRQSLCSCTSCTNLYKADQLDFLLDKKDSLFYYYSKAEDHDDHDDIEEVLTELPHSQAINIAEGIASLKRNLTKFMNSQDPSKIVTSKAVKDFFDNLKKRRLDGDD